MKPWLGYDIAEAQRKARRGVEHIDPSIPHQLISYAEADRGVVYVVGRGFWSETMVDDHFNELRRTASVVRRTVRSVRVLVDLRRAAVQSPAVAARIKDETRRVWTEQDRIAVVLQSTLAKLQIDRVVDNGNHASFVTIEDARDWLGLQNPAAPR